jgi:hypothetical protein
MSSDDSLTFDVTVRASENAPGKTSMNKRSEKWLILFKRVDAVDIVGPRADAHIQFAAQHAARAFPPSN